MPPFRTGTEALHGLAWLGPATVFPQALGLASTWDPELVTAVDLRGGVQDVAAAMHGPAGSTLTLRADDPVFGAALATSAADAPARRARIDGAIPGVRDLYLVFSAPGVTVRTLTFS